MTGVRVLAAPILSAFIAGCAPELPQYSESTPSRWAKQGWSDDDRHWFHHAPQGTSTFGLPYEWLVALQQPDFSFGEAKLLVAQAYLARFGFIPSPAALGDRATARKFGFFAAGGSSRYSDATNPANAANLPVGFAVSGEWYDPITQTHLPIPGTGRNARSLGLTCAACHTGQLEYGGNRILIDGGAGMISLDKFREALSVSFLRTRYLPWRYDAFARRVLGTAYNDDNKDKLKQQLIALFEKGKKNGDLEKAQARRPNAVAEGYARLDALNRIGNEVFQAQMALDGNIHPITGPVSYPYIWYTPWFDWVQYNSSIQQPMVRNLGEAMGVKGKVDLTHPEKVFQSRIPVKTLHEMETLLAGDEHPLKARAFGGLQPPKWGELPLPPLNQDLVAKGRKLYADLCAGCHLPAMSSAEADRNSEFWTDKHWKPVDPAVPLRYLALVTKPVLDIGTDCRTAYDMVYRNVTTPDFIRNSGIVIPPLKSGQFPPECPPPPPPQQRPGFKVTNFGVALGEVVQQTKQRWYLDNKISAAEQPMLNGHRPDPPASIRATVSSHYPDKHGPAQELPVYKARPLNGVWATAPFLHNGSVPNLYLLLSPQQERDAEANTFYVGSREFDPVNVGYKYRAEQTDTTGLFRFDTTIPGNRNTGHLFTNVKDAPGRIDPEFTPAERRALIEYLKSL